MGFRTFESSDPLLLQDGQAGLMFVTVKSAALRRRADITLFVPTQAAGRRDLPIAMLLHGVYGSHWAWAMKGRAHLTAARLMEAGAIAPMVLAMPSDGLAGDGSGYVAQPSGDAERWIIDEVPAAVRAACPSCSAASPLFIAGLSMGGFGALRLAGKYPTRVAAAAGHSSITDIRQLDALIEEAREGWSGAPQDQTVLAALIGACAPLPPLRFDCGRSDPCFAANAELHHALNEAGIAHEYAEHDGGHDWAYWARHLEDSLRWFDIIATQARLAAAAAAAAADEWKGP